ncbi:protein kinase [Lujinxingia vulgaris]|uniref:non-specific serine/threonine protein kinase n=1 Tax=Lujinxingia vulgaris TaxID=2600176 RepID=A0A5C6XMK3_9DELT|nr:protein kinase [Lujinxingia vulgaris]TXD38574.1 protein kinase [Lujinxingia vulgaris]
MSTDAPHDLQDAPRTDESLEQVRLIGTGELGESFEVLRMRLAEGESAEVSGEMPRPERFVLKKLTFARVRDPDEFARHFDSLTRLDHPNLARYREIFRGEQVTRLMRDYVDGMPLDAYLLRPITEAEQAILSASTSPDASTEAPAAALDEDDLPTIELPSTLDEDDLPPALDEPSSEGEESVPEEIAADRPNTLEIPESLLEDSEAADRALDLIILRIQAIGPQIVAALEYLHRFRKVHGGLKPTNILINDAGQVRLTDFGLHPHLERPGSGDLRSCYSAPELRRGEFSPAADLYALGVIFFEALAGKPFDACQRVIEGDEGPRPRRERIFLSEVAPHCPAAWVNLIHGLLASEPQRRPSLNEVLDLLSTDENRSVTIPATVVEDREVLYGRREIFDQLTERASLCAQERRLGLSVVEGPQGTGKTALIDALAHWASQLGWIVLRGRCFHRDTGAYQGWDEIAEQLAGIIARLPEKSRQRMETARLQAARIFPALYDRGEACPEVGRRSAIDALRRVLVELSEQRPVLIALEDTHFAGLDTSALLADLTNDPRGMRVFMVTSILTGPGKDHANHPFFGELATSPIALHRVEIHGFSKEEAREYVLANAANLSLRSKQLILRRGNLHPRLIDELIYEFEQAPTEASEELEAAEPVAVDELLTTFIRRRVAQLTRPERLGLQLLAVASSPLTAHTLGLAMGRELGASAMSAQGGEAVIATLLHRRLARQSRARAGEHQDAAYAIIHDRARNFVLDELGRDHHARLCGLIADALRESKTGSDARRLDYLRRAGRQRESVEVAFKVAHSAQSRFAWERALELWQLIDAHEPKDSPRRDEIHRALFEAAIALARTDQARDQLRPLLASGSIQDRLAIRRQWMEALLASGHPDEAIDTLDDALQEVGSAYRRGRLRAGLRAWRRRLAVGLARWSDATAVARDQRPPERTVETARLLWRASEASHLLLSARHDRLTTHFARLATVHNYGPWLARDRLQMVSAPLLPLLIDPTTPVDRWLDQSLTLSDRFDDPGCRARALELQGLLAAHRGRWAEARELLHKSISTLQKVGVDDAIFATRWLSHIIRVGIELGQLHEVMPVVDNLTHRLRHDRAASAHIALSRADLLIARGDIAEAALALSPASELAERTPNSLLFLEVTARRATIDLALGRPELVIAHLDLLRDQVFDRDFLTLPRVEFALNRALAHALASEAERQRTLQQDALSATLNRLHRTIRRLASYQDDLGLSERAALLRLRARLALLREQYSRAARLTRQAIELCASSQSVLSQTLNQEALGLILTRQERPEARQILESARALATTHHFYLPLVLEGWPVPRAHAVLKADPA